MQNTLGGYGRGAVVTGMVLAALALAGCENAEEQEIQALIEEAAALHEQWISEMESTAEAEIAAARENGSGWMIASTERLWERRIQGTRDAYERTLTRLREAQASEDVRAAQQTAEIWRTRQARIDAGRRVPDPSAWSTGEPAGR